VLPEETPAEKKKRPSPEKENFIHGNEKPGFRKETFYCGEETLPPGEENFLLIKENFLC
jgi:hypothetical protein